MSSAVRHQHLPALSKAERASPELPPAQPPGLLSSRVFWLGGLLSLGIWTLVFLAISVLFF